MKGEQLIHRFMKNIDPVPSVGGCRIWIGYRNWAGYGRFWFEGKMRQAHSIAATAYYGQPRKGQITLHRCDNPPCVNPQHLFYGTHKDNQQDAVRKGRHAGQDKRTHFKKLSTETAKEIYISQLPNSLLAKKFSMAPATICDIQKGRTWKWLTKDIA